MDKYKMRHRILQKLQKFLESTTSIDDVIRMKVEHEILELINDVSDNGKYADLARSQIGYLNKMGEIESTKEDANGNKGLFISITIEGYLAYWDDKYPTMRKELNRKIWQEITSICLTVLLIIINVQLLIGVLSGKSIKEIILKTIENILQ